jgi:hypothetical protein
VYFKNLRKNLKGFPPPPLKPIKLIGFIQKKYLQHLIK